MTCSAVSVDGVGRVVDFGEIKRILGGWLDEHLDHATVLCIHDPLVHVLKSAEENRRLCLLQENPTAEVLSWYLLNVFSSLLLDGVVVSRVTVYETPDCWATSEKLDVS